MTQPVPEPVPDQPAVKPKRPFWKKWWVWVLAVLGVLIVLGSIVETEEEKGSGPASKVAPSPTQGSSPAATTPQAAAPPPAAPLSAPTPAPIVIPSQLSFAKSKYKDISFDAVDVGPHIVDGVKRERGVFDPANWRIVTQFKTLDGKKLKVGVIKNDEFQVISQAGQGTAIADNSLSFLLGCPK